MIKASLPLLIFLSLFTSKLLAQEYLSYTKEGVITFLNESELNLSITEDSTSIKAISSGYDKYEANYFFTPSNFNGDLACDSILYQMKCKECADQMLQKLLNDSLEHWFEVQANRYISNKRTNWDVSFSKNRISDCKQMIVIQNPSEGVGTNISFAIKKMKTLEWKEITKNK